MPVTVSDDYLAPPDDNGFVGGLAGDNADNTGGGLPTGGGSPPPPDDYTNSVMANDASNYSKHIGEPYPGDTYAAAGMNVPPSPASVAPDDYTMQNMIASANAVNQSAGKPNPGDIVAASGGGLPTAPSAHTDTVTGTTPGISGGLPTSAGVNPDQFRQEFQNKYGFYDDRYNSMANMEHNLLEGDTNIRQQAEYMAQFDPNLQRELNAINAHPDFYHSENAVQHQLGHNQSLADQANALGGGTQGQTGGNFNGRLGAQPGSQQGGNQAQLNWLRSQVVDVPTGTPVSNVDMLFAQPERAKIVSDLAALGATNIQPIKIDNAGNWALSYTPASGGQPVTLHGAFVDSGDAQAQLDALVAKQQAAQAASNPYGGGGGGSRYGSSSRYSAPRGGGYGGGGGSTNAPDIPPGTPAGAQGAPSYETERYYQNTNPPLAPDYMASPSFDNSNMQQLGIPVQAYQPPTGFIPKRGQPY